MEQWLSSYIIGLVNMAGMVLVKEGDEVQEKVESAVYRLLPSHTAGPIPEPSHTHTGLNQTSSMIFHIYINTPDRLDNSQSLLNLHAFFFKSHCY